MRSAIATSSEKESKIELILVLQAHSINKNIVIDGVKQSSDALEILYSQFKIMQIVQSYPEAAVLNEGNHCDVTLIHRKQANILAFREIFPNYANLYSMDFDNLTENQRIVLTNNQGVQILFHMGCISAIYQTQKTKYDVSKLAAEYVKIYRQSLFKFPLLAATAIVNECISYNNLETMGELRDYENHKRNVYERHPAMFSEREKEALDLALVAAQKSGKKQVVLVFGKLHEEGLINLINTIYSDRIVLKKCIDSTEGFNSPGKRKKLAIEHEEAMRLYKREEYEAARTLFEKQVSFWQATPNSTPSKLPTLLNAEYNLGSCLLKMGRLNAALPHLKRTVEISQELNPKNKQDTKKFKDRYEEALKHQQVSEEMSMAASGSRGNNYFLLCLGKAIFAKTPEVDGESRLHLLEDATCIELGQAFWNIIKSIPKGREFNHIERKFNPADVKLSVAAILDIYQKHMSPKKRAAGMQMLEEAPDSASYQIGIDVLKVMGVDVVEMKDENPSKHDDARAIEEKLISHLFESFFEAHQSKDRTYFAAIARFDVLVRGYHLAINETNVHALSLLESFAKIAGQGDLFKTAMMIEVMKSFIHVAREYFEQQEAALVASQMAVVAEPKSSSQTSQPVASSPLWRLQVDRSQSNPATLRNRSILFTPSAPNWNDIAFDEVTGVYIKPRGM